MWLTSTSFIIRFPFFLSPAMGVSAAAVLDSITDLINNKALQPVQWY